MSLRRTLPLLTSLILTTMLGAAPARVEAAPPEPNAARRQVLEPLDCPQRCALAFLEHLGWRVVPGPAGSGIQVIGGHPSQRPSIEAAQRAGDLQIRVAPDTPVETIQELALRLDGLADTLPSRLAMKHRIALGVQRASRKLEANIKRGNLKFPKLVVINSPWFKMKQPIPEWSPGKLECRAVAPPSKAIEVFYNRSAVIECYVGQWVALYATWYEVFGAQAFDEEFRSEEFMLGRPGEMRSTPFGKYLRDEYCSNWRALVIGPKDYDIDAGLAFARMGPMAFPGTAGVVENVDAETCANDNFVFVSVSPAACKALRENGGFEYIARLSEKIWEIHRAGWRGASRGSSGKEARDEVKAILARPVFSEILLSIHPYGVIELGKIIEKRMVLTYRPMKVRIYRNGVENAFYERYRSWFRKRCRGTCSH